MGKTGNLFASIFFICMGTGFAIGAIRLGIGKPTEPQPGFFPFLDGMVLLILSLILLLKTLRRRGGEAPSLRKMRGPGVLVMGLVLYVATLDVIGYIIATALLAATVLRVLETRSKAVLLAASLILAIGSYVLFDRFLGVPLPNGILTGLW